MSSSDHPHHARSSSPSSPSSRRANLFSKWRQRDKEQQQLHSPGVGPPLPTASGRGSERPHHRHATTNEGSDPLSTPGRRESAPDASSAAAAAASRAKDDGGLRDMGGSERRASGQHRGGRHRSRSRSRPRERAGEKGGSSEGKDRPRSRSLPRSRHRSRGRSSRAGEAGAATTAATSSAKAVAANNEGEPKPGAEREESLRDYWKRRAEESKERIGSTNASGAPVTPGGGGSSSWGEKVDSSSSVATRSTASGGTHEKPPPPPREASRRQGSSGVSISGGRARSKSRERKKAVGGDSSRKPPQSGSTPRKVDSIASALVGHPRKSDASRSSRGASSSAVSSRRSQSPHDASEAAAAAVTEDLSSLSPLHHALATAAWPTLHRHLRSLASKPTSEMAAQLSLPHPRQGGTVLHVAAWKAPPLLAVEMMRHMPRGSREMSVLLSIRDGEGNTPLHLCCGNLECGGGMENEGKEGVDPLAVLREMAQSAPNKAWTVQNSEGDTPLHMLVASPLCCADWRTTSTSSGASGSAKATLAAEAMNIALSSPDALDACLVREPTGATPLHISLACGAHDAVVEALLKAQPSAATVKDARGLLPLHWAAAFGRAGHAAVKKLIEEHPPALLATTVDGDIPLHLAVSNAMMEDENGGAAGSGGRSGSLSSGEGDAAGSSSSGARVDKNRLKILELLMHPPHHSSSAGRGRISAEGDKASPILATNREKLTPLHCCALFDAPPQISKLLMKHPDANAASSMTNSFGATPLHLAAAQPGVSQSIATVLAIGSPDAAAVQDRLKRTPLHVAAQNTYATNLLIKTLAELNPAAAAVKTQRGHLPLHLAAQSQAKEAVIRALIKAYPAAAEARNKSNNTPLHDAAKYRAGIGAVRLLLDAYPGALYVQNQYGNLPLHCATAYQAPADVVQLLLKSWPEGASMQNRNHDAPLHYAAAYATSAMAVKPLIDAAPAAVLSLNSSGQSPVDRARANNAPGEIVRLLEKAAEDYSRNAASGDGSWASFGAGGGPSSGQEKGGQGGQKPRASGGGGGASSKLASF